MCNAFRKGKEKVCEKNVVSFLKILLSSQLVNPKKSSKNENEKLIGFKKIDIGL
jgi:hypothetical protein